MKRRLLFVVNVDWFFISHRLPIAHALLSLGVEVHLACHFTDHKQELENMGIITHTLPLSRSGISFVTEVRLVIAMLRVLMRVRPNIVHLVSIKPVVYGSVLCRLLRDVKVVASISGLGYVFTDQSQKAKFLRFLVTFCYRVGLRSDKASVIFQNSSDMDLFSSRRIIKCRQAILIKGSGVDLDKFPYYSQPSGSSVVMFMARFLKDKGILEFIGASILLKEKYPECRFVLVGGVDTENPNSIDEQELDGWITSNVVEYWGYSKDVAATLKRAHIIVLPSYREGLPKSLIEAAACGRAVITTDVPGCRDAIDPSVSGLLVPSKDKLALADAIETLICNETRRREFGESGRRLAERCFDLKSVVASHLKIYGLER